MFGFNRNVVRDSKPPFTEASHQLLADARRESDRLEHEYIGTEHLLLALTQASQSDATLDRLGVDREAVRSMLTTTISKGHAKAASTETLPFTSRTQQALTFAADSARTRGHAGVTVAHLVVGMLREGKNIAAQVLQDQGVTVERALAQIEPSGTDEAGA